MWHVYQGEYIGLQLRISERGITQIVTYCNRTVGVSKLDKNSVTYFVNGPLTVAYVISTACRTVFFRGEGALVMSLKS